MLANASQFLPKFNLAYLEYVLLMMICKAKYHYSFATWGSVR